ncbi:hypothetical protein PQR01_33705 [Paraburkholderia rhynchosiae]|uniref:Uncharacterized protein n=1 Tax=Paraburkholderia rhynchosiae TaxID=487049 RepID=A0ACC7NL60_9BURK
MCITLKRGSSNFGAAVELRLKLLTGKVLVARRALILNAKHPNLLPRKRAAPRSSSKPLPPPATRAFRKSLIDLEGSRQIISEP